MTLIHTLNERSAIWAEAMCGSLIDTSVLLIVVAVAWLLLRKRISAHVGYCLFLIVVVKAMIPLEFSGPNWAAELSPRVQLGRLFAEEETPDPQPQQVRLTPPVSVPAPIPIAETETVDLAPSDFAWETAPQVEAAAFHDVPVLPDPTPPTAPAAATPAGPLEREEIATTTLFMLAWLLGTIGMTSWFATVQFRFRRRLRGAAEVAAEELPVDFAALCKQAGVRASVRLLSVKGVSSPAIWGLRKPRLLLPPDFTSMFSQQQMRWILLHELAHVRRRDLWVTLFQRLVQIVHFFNPAVWIANRIVDRLREYACDDAATIGAESSRRDCGEAFLRAVERANAQPQTLEPALGIFRPGRAFHRRLFRILDPNRRIQARLSYRSGLLLLLLAALVLPCVRAAEEESESNAAPEIADAQEDSNEAEPAKYIANLPDGSRVELVGVSAHPSRGRRWWRADGSTLPAAPYAHVDGNEKVGGGMIGREFVFRISGALGLAHPYIRDAEIKQVGSNSSSSNGVPSNEEGEPMQDLYVNTFAMPVGTKQANFRVSLPEGDWKSFANFQRTSSFATTFTLDNTSYGLTVTPAQQIGTDVVLNFAHNATKEKIQVVAIETDGKTQHKHGRLSVLGAGSFMQMTATFSNLKLSDVKRFSIQIRKQNYVKFENISTIPGHKTDVQISVEGAPKTTDVIASKLDESADEQQPFIVQGRVTDAEGKPIPEAKMSLYKLSSGDSLATPIYITNTDKEGRYKHRFEPDSLWLTGHPDELLRIGVSVEKPGYQMTEAITYYPAVNRLPDERLLTLSGKSADDILVRGKPKTIDFVLSPWNSKTAPLSPEQTSFVRDLSDVTKPIPASRVKSDEKAILGKWKIFQVIGDGSTAQDSQPVYTFLADGIGVVKSKTEVTRFKYTLHTDKSPKSLSLKVIGESAKLTESLYYLLDGDRLKLVPSQEDKNKPVDFNVETAAKSNSLLMVLTRVTDEPSKGAAQKEKLNPPGWGSVTGQFLLAGEVPQPRVLVAEGDTRAKDSAISAVKTIYSEELIVDPKSKGIANVFVYVRKVPKIHPDLLHSKTKTVVCESDGLVYKPHAMLLRTDQQLVCKNADPVVINVHSFPQRNVGFNAILPPEERESIPFSIRQSEHRPFAIKNDLHAWMSAHCLVLDHPYAAITDKKGRFTIENLPVGEHELVFWHEKWGLRRRSVRVKSEELKSIGQIQLELE